MGLILFANNAGSSLAGPITNSATTANLASGTGSLFPSPSGGDLFVGTFTDAATGLLTEIVHVTAMLGDVISTMVRAQEGTTAKSWLPGDLFNNLVTAGTMAAMVQQVSLSPTRVITTSGAFTMTLADANGAVGLNRTSGVSTSSTTLPSGAQPGNVFYIEDLAKNFSQDPVTVSYPGGQFGPGGATQQVLNVNGQSAEFRYYGSNQWSFKA